MGKSIWDDQLKQDPINTPIRLSPNDQNLEIEFSSLDFHNLDQIRYAYRMVGIDNAWIYLNDRKNSAFYNRLDKGKYTFQVKATDKNGLWSNEVTEITIHRLPAWYETWWAYLFYTLLVMGIIGYSIYAYLKRMKRKNDEKWADSAELVKMHQYLDTKDSISTSEFAEIDKLLLDRATKAVEEHLNEPDLEWCITGTGFSEYVRKRSYYQYNYTGNVFLKISLLSPITGKCPRCLRMYL